MENNQKQTIWQSVKEVHLQAMADGSCILTDSLDVLVKEDGHWWQKNGIVANLKSVKEIIIIPTPTPKEQQ